MFNKSLEKDKKQINLGRFLIVQYFLILGIKKSLGAKYGESLGCCNNSHLISMKRLRAIYLCCVGIGVLRSIVPPSVTNAARKLLDAYNDPSDPIFSRKCRVWSDFKLGKSLSSIWYVLRSSALEF